MSALQIPHVNRQEYTLLDVSEDGYVSLILIFVNIAVAAAVAKSNSNKCVIVSAAFTDGRGWKHKG